MVTERKIFMEASVQSKTQRSGRSYFYIVLSYKEYKTQKNMTKWISTGMEVRGNKKRAESMIPEIKEKYAFLERKNGSMYDFDKKEYLVADYVSTWLSRKKFEVYTSTYEGYVTRAKHIIDYFRERKTLLIDLTPKEVDDFFVYLLRYGKKNQKTKELEPLKVRTVRSIRGIFEMAMEQAIIDGFIKTNPVNGVKVKGKKDSDYRKDECFMTAEEVKDFLDFIRTEYPRLFPIAYLCTYYGFRRSEVLGLRWRAINFQKRTITINHTVVRIITKEARDATKTKSSERELELLSNVIPILMKLKQEQKENKRIFGDNYIDNEDYVFTWENGKQYDPDYISKLFKKASAKYGRPDITLHKLRHSCASILFELGWDMKRIQYWLGHSDWGTTMNIYTHYNRKRLIEGNTDLDKMLDLKEESETQILD